MDLFGNRLHSLPGPKAKAMATKALFERLFTGKPLSSFGGQTQNLLGNAALAKAPQGLGQPASLVQFKGSPNDPQMITATVYAQLMIMAGVAGPLTGIVTWGSGNGQNMRAEFDVPVMGNADLTSLIGGYSGGVLISVPASVMELQVRNDASLIPAGDGTHLGAALNTINSPAAAFANLATGTKSASNARLTRTIWLYFDPTAGAASFQPGAIATCTVPPFATSFIVLRGGGTPNDASQAITISMTRAFQLCDGPYTVAANVRSPEFPITGWIDGVIIKNTGAASIDSLAVQFNLSL